MNGTSKTFIKQLYLSPHLALLSALRCLRCHPHHWIP